MSSWLSEHKATTRNCRRFVSWDLFSGDVSDKKTIRRLN
nr:MAG TPA: hypothetical protein [Caudoviricetes sp.]